MKIETRINEIGFSEEEKLLDDLFIHTGRIMTGYLC